MLLQESDASGASFGVAGNLGVARGDVGSAGRRRRGQPNRGRRQAQGWPVRCIVLGRGRDGVERKHVLQDFLFIC